MAPGAIKDGKHTTIFQDKPGVEQFITMNRGINDGKDVPKELLISLFDR